MSISLGRDVFTRKYSIWPLALNISETSAPKQYILMFLMIRRIQ